MKVLKVSGQVYGASLTASEKKALDIEAKKAVAGYLQMCEEQIEAQVIWGLKQALDLTDDELKLAFGRLSKGIDELIDYYSMCDADGAWLANKALIENGIDIHKWREELKGQR